MFIISFFVFFIKDSNYTIVIMNYYIAFDVGIKNLSYCASRIDNKNNIDILHWGLIDNSILLPSCSKCKKDASMYSKTNDSFYCKRDAKQITEKLTKIKNMPEYQNSFDVQMLRIYTNLELFYQKITKYYNQDERMKNITVIIENQPSLTNPIMKTISTAIYLFFLHKKMYNPEIISSVKFLSATVKTSVFFTNFLKLDKAISSNHAVNKYSSRKKFTVDIVQQYIRTLPNNIYNIVAQLLFEYESKKDDLADSFLYVIYYHYKDHIMNNKTKYGKKN